MTILKVENIVRSYGKRKVLKGVSFKMKQGALVGIVGENGSGKTTLLKIIVGELRSEHGEVHLFGSSGYCPQKTLLFSQLTVEEHFRYFASAYGLSSTSQRISSEHLMNIFKFSHYKKFRVGNLSGGTQQKLNLALSILHRPQLLILDEPYNGFDWDTYMKFWDYARTLQMEGCAILVVTHFLTEKERFDHIYELQNGKLICN